MAALHGLLSKRPTEIEAVKRLIHADDPEVVRAALDNVRLIDAQKLPMDRLVGLVGHPNPALQRSAIDAIAEIGIVPAVAVEEIITHGLTSPDDDVRFSSVRALGRASSDASVRASSVLADQMLSDTEIRVRREAVEAIYEHGPSAFVAIPELREALAHQDSDLQVGAVHALEVIGTSQAYAVLEEAAKSSPRVATAQAAQRALDRQRREPSQWFAYVLSPWAIVSYVALLWLGAGFSIYLFRPGWLLALDAWRAEFPITLWGALTLGAGELVGFRFYRRMGRVRDLWVQRSLPTALRVQGIPENGDLSLLKATGVDAVMKDGMPWLAFSGPRAEDLANEAACWAATEHEPRMVPILVRSYLYPERFETTLANVLLNRVREVTNSRISQDMLRDLLCSNRILLLISGCCEKDPVVHLVEVDHDRPMSICICGPEFKTDRFLSVIVADEAAPPAGFDADRDGGDVGRS